ncbi:hypothetical protein E4S99_15065 [Listeria monocytogenes]|uniref:hypothetical protein n=1 Tax=Listeria monocytogenes TaxID=1639 RepID=UPI000E74D30D|nr:hypothetical protein [Listeria monocytogenes]EAC2921748.1 hypothetical protein [Listeria monocytogenes]EAC5867594.1 hypothetical protein [Listeria monocytogenes]EAC8118349.1 hypothetical protein [Listeria monocytogenes]EAD2103881.1 hypothetical protein [Listeria monocytogenes]EAD3070706.1 hypothetical protein [Listeria monocytogenes]
MEQELKISNAEYLKLNKRIQSNEKYVESLKEDLQEHSETMSKMQAELEEVKHNRVLNEDTLSLMMENAVRNGLSDVMSEIKAQDERIRNLEVDKYKTAYQTIKWFSIAGGTVIVTFIVTSLIKAIVN